MSEKYEVLKKYNFKRNQKLKKEWTDLYYELPEEVKLKFEKIMWIKPDFVYLPKAKLTKNKERILTSGWRYGLYYIDEWKLKKILNNNTNKWWTFYSKTRKQEWFDVIQSYIRFFQRKKQRK